MSRSMSDVTPGPSQADSKRQGLISVNNLNYVLEPDLSVATNCTFKNHFFQQNKYTANQQAVCIVNSGADYIDTRRSYLRFKLNIKSSDPSVDADDVRFKSGSAMNLIDSITISSRSGDELARIRKANLWSATIHRYRHSQQFKQTIGQAMGWDHEFGTLSGLTTKSETFCIPMYILSDFFNQAKLLPSMLMSGIRIEITWAPSTVAFGSTGSTVDYEIEDPYFSLKSVQLTDATQRALNEMSAVNGLEVVYCDWENTEQQLESNQCHIEVRKASSRALKAFVKVRRTSQMGGSYDDMRSISNPVIKYQWQLGSLYFPQQPVSGTTPADINAEAYLHTLDAFDKLQPSSIPPYMQFSHATNLGTEDDFKSGGTVLGVTLERSTLFNFSGVPINNSRVLAFRAMFEDGNHERNVNVFLKYVKLARVFLNNVEVEQ